MLRLGYAVAVAALVAVADGAPRESRMTLLGYGSNASAAREGLLVEGSDTQRYIDLPADYEAQTGPYFSEEPVSVSLPPANVALFIYVSGSRQPSSKLNRVEYVYSGEDIVYDVMKYVAERSGVSLSLLTSLSVKKFNAIGTSVVDITDMKSKKLSEIPLSPGDELEVAFEKSVDASAVKVMDNPVVSPLGVDTPGFIDVRIKLAGMPLASLAIPRTSNGELCKQMVLDRLIISSFDIEMRRSARRGKLLNPDEMVIDGDPFFFATLLPKDGTGGDGDYECCYGFAELSVSTGATRFMDITPKTTVKDVKLYLDNLNLLPSSEEAPMGFVVSTKGFFNEKSIDALEDDALLGQNGLRSGGTVFVNVYCPVVALSFMYNSVQFPQLFNCTGKLHYMDSVFYSISGRSSTPPRYYRLKEVDGTTVEDRLDTGVSLLRQLGDSNVVIVKYMPESSSITASVSVSASPSPSPSFAPPMFTATPSPSMTVLGEGKYDSMDDRMAEPPVNAIKLSGPSETALGIHR